MNNQNNAPATVGSGLDFFGALTIAFIVLRLCHVITWSWLWVLSPIWIPLLVFSALCLIASHFSE